MNIEELKLTLDKIRKTKLYTQGRIDCENNIIPNETLGDDYLRGYADEFAKEKQQSRELN